MSATDHYGPNWRDLQWLVERIQPRPCPLCGCRISSGASGFDGDGAVADHAGKVEASLLWALEPACVDVSRFPAEGQPSARGHHFAMGRDAREANREIGRRMVGYEVTFLARKVETLIADYDRLPPPANRLESFGDVERFWAEHVEPSLPAFASMDGYLVATEEVASIPPDSGWRRSSRD